MVKNDTILLGIVFVSLSLEMSLRDRQYSLSYSRHSVVQACAVRSTINTVFVVSVLLTKFDGFHITGFENVSSGLNSLHNFCR